MVLFENNVIKEKSTYSMVESRQYFLCHIAPSMLAAKYLLDQKIHLGFLNDVIGKSEQTLWQTQCIVDTRQGIGRLLFGETEWSREEIY